MDNKQAKDACLKLLRQYTNKEIVKITTSGDAAIFAALSIAKQQGYHKVIIPDQGGWLTYKTFPQLLDMEVIEIETDYGVIDPEILTRYNNAVLLYTSYAGYFAAQDVAAIYKEAKKQEMLVILDASGALSHSELCNGNNADIILGSFGKWKIVNNGCGGFVSSNTDSINDAIKQSDIFKVVKTKQMDYEILKQKLEDAPQRLHFLIETAKKLKQKCHFDIIHNEKEGINVVVKYKDNEEKEKIIGFCKDNQLEYKECPLYIKVLEKAISVEVKRLYE